LFHSPIFPQAATGDSLIATKLRKLYTDVLVGVIPGNAAELREAQGSPCNSRTQQDAQEYLAALRDQQPSISAATEIQCEEVLKCTACSAITKKNATLLEIPVALTGANDLQALIRDLSVPEVLLRTCDECGGMQAEKTTEVKDLPPMVIIQLKRFSFDTATMQPTKISNRIDCPLEGLSIPLREGSALYDLHATVEHYGGSPVGGHYVAHVLDSLSNTWFTFDDSRAEHIDETRVISGDTYILFYVAKAS
jgi:ubiquitin C-terminal hydrolase